MTSKPGPGQPPPFRLGVNYWPARTAMAWWSAFDRAEVAEDFGRIAACGFDSVRIFLTWKDFQPAPSRTDPAALERLVSTFDTATSAGLSVMPTLFTGHMSGVNWIPAWALGGDAGDDRFRVVSGDRVTDSRPANWYVVPSIIQAQSALASDVARALAGHEALFAWDLGNENSNCAIPQNRIQAREWLSRMAGAIREADGGALVTLGLHMEDLAEDRKLGPREAAEACDFLTMHGYPGYVAWADGPTDERVLAFLVRVTRWLGEGADVLLSEFGVPTKRSGRTERRSGTAGGGPALVAEAEAAAYVARALDALLGSGGTGAMLWCYSDYAEAIWGRPPLDLAIHERTFGLWRADASAKPAATAIETFAQRSAVPLATPRIADSTWLDLDATQFYREPGSELPRLFRRYCEALSLVRPPEAPGPADLSDIPR